MGPGTQAIGALVELGIDFVPVPGVKTAFTILSLIWENVQKASNNKDALKNLAVSVADILIAVNYVLEENDPNKHVHDMLRKMESVLTDIQLFAAEHANMNLFKLLIKNVDVDGKVEFFQNRLQKLWVAFSIAALGSIGSEVHLIHQAVQPGFPPVRAPPIHNQKSEAPPHSGNSKVGTNKPQQFQKKTSTKPGPQGASLRKPNQPQEPRDIPKKPVLVGVSSTIPYRIEVRKNAPCLSSRYNYEEGMEHWGFRSAGMTVTKNLNTFQVYQQEDSKMWKWTLVGAVISVSRHDPVHPKWSDSMDIVFSRGNFAVSWFSWFEAYATSPQSVKTLKDPPVSDVTLRKKNSHSLMRNSATTIDYKRPIYDWRTFLGGHSQNAREHASQLTYISSSLYGRLPFCTVYRSGDMLVHERFVRADSLEPTISRRYRFESESQARTWYTLCKNCVMSNRDMDPLAQVTLVTKYDCEIKTSHDKPVLSTSIWPDINLRDWAAPKFGRSESFMSTTFEWRYKQDSKITVTAILGSRPDWVENLVIEFGGVQSASSWFGYLTGYDTGVENPSIPHIENVTITSTRIYWMRKTGDSIETRAATSDKWGPIFARSYKKLEVQVSHISAITSGSSMLPVIRIWTVGNTLYLDRRRSVEESKSSVSRQYKFDSEAEMQTWYDIWTKHLQKVASATPK